MAKMLVCICLLYTAFIASCECQTSMSLCCAVLLYNGFKNLLSFIATSHDPLYLHGAFVVQTWFGPSHEIMVLFFLHKLIYLIAHAHPSSGARCLIFGPTLRLLPYLCVRTVKSLARLLGCAGSPEPSLVAYVKSTIISCAGSFCFC